MRKAEIDKIVEENNSLKAVLSKIINLDTLFCSEDTVVIQNFIKSEMKLLGINLK